MHRIHYGHVPNLDFPSILGPLNLWGPYVLSRFTATPFGALPAYIFALTALLSAIHFGLNRRVHPLVSGIAMVAVVSLGCRLVRLGGVDEVTMVGFYRRLSAAAFVLFVTYLASRSLARDRQHPVVDGVLLGLLYWIVLYTKASYLLSMAGLAGIALLLFSALRPALIISLLTLLGLVAATEICLPGHTWAYLSDLIDASGIALARQSHWGEHLVKLFATHGIELAVTLPLPIALGVSLFRGGDRRRFARYATLSLAVIAGWVLVDKYDNGPENWAGVIGLALGTGAALLAPSRSPQPAGKRRNRWTTAVAISLGLCVLPHAWSAEKSLWDYTQRERVAAEGLEPSQLFLAGLVTKPPAAEYLLSGVSFLTTALPEPTDREAVRLFVLDLANPFSLLLDLEPPKGAALWIHPGLNISHRSRTPFDEVVGNSTHILSPKYPLWDLSNGFLIDAYQKVIERDFARVAGNQDWTLFRRIAPQTQY
jgi:hypothetical protein